MLYVTVNLHFGRTQVLKSVKNLKKKKSKMMEVYVKEDHEFVDGPSQTAGETEDSSICEKIKEEIIIEPELSGMLEAAEEIEEEPSEKKNTTDNQIIKRDRICKSPRAPAANTCDAQPQKKQRRQPTKTHTCETCHKVFNRINNLKNHQQTHKQVTNCKLCQKDLLTRKKLRNHIRRFHSEQPYSCKECNKEFKEAYELKRHIRIHTGEKPYLCEMCEKAFSNAGALKEHRQTHNDIKPFSCDACPKQFKHKYSLKIHLLTHTGRKPYPCDICTKDFIRSADLREHMLSHGTFKPYACDKCGTQFSRKDTFYRHAKRKFCMSVSDEKARLVRNEDCSWMGAEDECETEVKHE